MASGRRADAWGDGDVSPISSALGAANEERSATAAAGGSSSDPGDFSVAPKPQRLLPCMLQPAAGSASLQGGAVTSLRALCLGFLGRHVESMVAQLGQHLDPLPSDVKACLLCAARRRGVLGNRVLLALADEGWTLLDLAGATALSERALRQALMRCPRLRALDLTGLAVPSATLLRDLPVLCPALELLAVGGSKALEEVLLEVLPDILPHMRVRHLPDDAVQDSWEDGDGMQVPDPGMPCGLQRLKLLVWPHSPALVRYIVRSVSPRVEVTDSLPQLPLPVPVPVQDPYGSTCSRRGTTRSEPAATTTAGSTTIEQQHSALAGSSSSSPVASTGGAVTQRPIIVLRVRKPSALAPDTAHRPGSAAASASKPARGGRYTAPHLRQRPPQQQQAATEPSEARAKSVAASRPQPTGQARAQDEPAPPAQPPRPHGTAVAQSAATHLRPGYQRQLQAQNAHLTYHNPKRPQLDDCLACLAACGAWEGLGGGPGGEAVAVEELHIAEKFRIAYEEQDARLRAKAEREAAAAERYELRTSGAARALARWLDAE